MELLDISGDVRAAADGVGRIIGSFSSTLGLAVDQTA